MVFYLNSDAGWKWASLFKTIWWARKRGRKKEVGGSAGVAKRLGVRSANRLGSFNVWLSRRCRSDKGHLVNSIMCVLWCSGQAAAADRRRRGGRGGGDQSSRPPWEVKHRVGVVYYQVRLLVPLPPSTLHGNLSWTHSKSMSKRIEQGLEQSFTRANYRTHRAQNISWAYFR